MIGEGKEAIEDREVRRGLLTSSGSALIGNSLTVNRKLGGGQVGGSNPSSSKTSEDSGCGGRELYESALLCFRLDLELWGGLVMFTD